MLTILEFIWEVLPLVMGVLIIIVLLRVIGQIVTIRMQTVSNSSYSFKKLATELKEENTKILSELADMKETISSIDKMMKEIG